MKILFQSALSFLAMVSFAYMLSATAGDKIDSSRTKMTSLNVVNVGSKNSFSDTNLQLQASIPENLTIADEHIQWIVNSKGRVVKKLQGKTQALKLPEGGYNIKLVIGQFSTEKEVSVLAGKHIQPYFRADVARLQLSSNQVVDWLLIGSEQRQFTIRQRIALDELLPADNYRVKAVLRDIPLHQTIRLKPGKTVKQAMNVPVGKVRLVAIKDNQPLLRPMLWKIYRLDNNQRQQVGKYRLHTKSISVPPGHYEAVAEHQDTVRKRQFWVQKGTTNKVILGLD